MNALTYADALVDPHLLGALPCFREPDSWAKWRVFLKAVEGLPLTADEQATYCLHTGRTVYAPPAGGFREVLAVVGRQSGKSTIAGAMIAVDALRAQPGTYCAIVAQDSRGAQRAVHAYAAAPFDTLPAFSSLVTGRAADTVTLRRNIRIATYPCRPSALRGIRAKLVVLDEAAFFVSTEGRAVDREMATATRPATLTTNGRLVILSSPYGQSGIVFDLFRKHYGQDDSPVLVWRASSPAMNPTLDAAALARLKDEDPDAFDSEINALFRAGLAQLFDPEAVDACVDRDVRERAPVRGVRFLAACDISGGRRDRACVAVAHLHGERAVLDAVRVWHPPFDPESVIGEASSFLTMYGIGEVVGDAYAAEFTVGAFARHGIAYRAADRDRSAVYLGLLPLVNSGRVVVLDHALLLRELKTLERRRGPSGRDRVDHRPGSHDDVANACALALVDAHRQLSDPRQQPILVCEFSGRVREAIYPDGRVVDGRLLAMPRVDLHAMSDPLFADALACRQAYDRSLQPRG
jgi:hypothetical protein